MSNINYHQEPLYILDALIYLDNHANNKHYTYEKKLLRNDVDITTFKQTLSIIDNYTFNSLELFKYFDNNETSIANCLFFSFLNAFDFEQNNLKQKLISNINNFMSSKVNSLSLKHHFIIDKGTNLDTIDAILNLEINNDKIIQLLQAFRNPEHYIDIILTDINKIIPHLKTLYNQYFVTGSLEYFNNATISKMLSGIYSDEKQEYLILPSVTSFDLLRMNIDDQRKENAAIMFVGILIDNKKVAEFSFFDNIEERLSYFTKVINDKSKMKIVELLKEKEMYGAQIAEALNLKTSTISYHIDTLLNAGIISATKVDNRVIYTYDKDKSLIILDYLRDKFI